MNLVSANSNFFTQLELRLTYRPTEYKFLFHRSIYPTVLFTNHRPIFFLFAQKSKSQNQRVNRFQLILMTFPNLQLVWTAGKVLAFQAHLFEINHLN